MSLYIAGEMGQKALLFLKQYWILSEMYLLRGRFFSFNTVITFALALGMLCKKKEKTTEMERAGKGI